MRWKRPFLVVGVWAGIYFLPMIPDFENVDFYKMQIISSVILATALFQIDKRFPGSFLSSLSILGIMISTTIFAMMNWGFFGNIREEYDLYGEFQNTLNIIELCFLAVGVITIGGSRNGRYGDKNIPDLFYLFSPAFNHFKTIRDCPKKVPGMEKNPVKKH